MMRYLHCFMYWIFATTIAWAQPTFTMNTVDTDPNTVFDVQISSSGLVQIASIQFSINWDPTVIKFEEVKDFNLPQLTEFNFGQTNVEDGDLGLSWYYASGSGEGFTNEAVLDLFKLQFRSLGGGDITTTVEFSDSPIPIEVADTTLMDIGMNQTNATINISLLNKVEEINSSTIVIGQNVPNPFAGETFIPIEISKREQITNEIIDLTGAQIYEYAEFFNPGLHKINIPSRIFPSNGTYLYSVLIGEKKVAKKLFYNGK